MITKWSEGEIDGLVEFLGRCGVSGRNRSQEKIGNLKMLKIQETLNANGHKSKGRISFTVTFDVTFNSS